MGILADAREGEQLHGGQQAIERHLAERAGNFRLRLGRADFPRIGRVDGFDFVPRRLRRPSRRPTRRCVRRPRVGRRRVRRPTRRCVRRSVRRRFLRFRLRDQQRRGQRFLQRRWLGAREFCRRRVDGRRSGFSCGRVWQCDCWWQCMCLCANSCRCQCHWQRRLRGRSLLGDQIEQKCIWILLLFSSLVTRGRDRWRYASVSRGGR